MKIESTAQASAVNAEEPVHLLKRDRWALAFRIVGTLAGFAVIGLAFATSSWNDRWILVFFACVTAGGAGVYHLLTSIVPCPKCGENLFNFGIGPAGSRRKLFQCRRCGAKAWLAEGFYWQSDFSG